MTASQFTLSADSVTRVRALTMALGKFELLDQSTTSSNGIDLAVRIAAHAK